MSNDELNSIIVSKVKDIIFHCEDNYLKKYYRFSIMYCFYEEDLFLIGHESVAYETDQEHKICSLTNALKQIIKNEI